MTFLHLLFKSERVTKLTNVKEQICLWNPREIVRVFLPRPIKRREKFSDVKISDILFSDTFYLIPDKFQTKSLNTLLKHTWSLKQIYAYKAWITLNQHTCDAWKWWLHCTLEVLEYVDTKIKQNILSSRYISLAVSQVEFVPWKKRRALELLKTFILHWKKFKRFYSDVSS